MRQYTQEKPTSQTPPSCHWKGGEKQRRVWEKNGETAARHVWRSHLSTAWLHSSEGVNAPSLAHSSGLVVVLGLVLVLVLGLGLGRVLVLRPSQALRMQRRWLGLDSNSAVHQVWEVR